MTWLQTTFVCGVPGIVSTGAFAQARQTVGTAELLPCLGGMDGVDLSALAACDRVAT
jgi:hypothetical protein